MLWAVIMAGGTGTRFWPESRITRPKQFLPIFGNKTLFEQTCDRVSGLVPKSRILAVTHQRYQARIRALAGLPASQIIGEPVGRNTAPCAILAAAWALRRDPEAVIALLPADHRIGKTQAFKSALRKASRLAEKTGLPVTFGIKPDSPHTGYGYLEMGARAEAGAYRLKRFHEKPDLRRARAFVKSGRFLWNSGMFVWRADALLAAAARFLPEAKALAEKIVAGNLSAGMKRLYAGMPSVSIDYGLMERLAGKILTVPADIQWEDLGGWLAYAKLWPADRQGNVVQGNALLVESSGSVVRGGKRLIAAVGLKDYVIVDSGDALLICPKDRTESIRRIVDELSRRKWKQYL